MGSIAFSMANIIAPAVRIILIPVILAMPQTEVETGNFTLRLIDKTADYSTDFKHIDSVIRGFLGGKKANKIISHGCHCSKISDHHDQGYTLGGRPVDDIDLICKDWFAARNCIRKNGGICYEKDESFYSVTSGFCENDNGNACTVSTCSIDVFYVNLLKDSISKRQDWVDSPDCFPGSVGIQVKDACCGSWPNLQLYAQAVSKCVDGHVSPIETIHYQNEPENESSDQNESVDVDGYCSGSSEVGVGMLALTSWNQNQDSGNHVHIYKFNPVDEKFDFIKTVEGPTEGLGVNVAKNLKRTMIFHREKCRLQVKLWSSVGGREYAFDASNDFESVDLGHPITDNPFYNVDISDLPVFYMSGLGAFVINGNELLHWLPVGNNDRITFSGSGIIGFTPFYQQATVYERKVFFFNPNAENNYNYDLLAADLSDVNPTDQSNTITWTRNTQEVRGCNPPSHSCQPHVAAINGYFLHLAWSDMTTFGNYETDGIGAQSVKDTTSISTDNIDGIYYGWGGSHQKFGLMFPYENMCYIFYGTADLYWSHGTMKVTLNDDGTFSEMEKHAWDDTSLKAPFLNFLSEDGNRAHIFTSTYW